MTRSKQACSETAIWANSTANGSNFGQSPQFPDSKEKVSARTSPSDNPDRLNRSAPDFAYFCGHFAMFSTPSPHRLVRDGVDTPLANLFVHAAWPEPADREGVDRARSATEAFLYRRLESLPETAGRFRLNEELPILFDGWGKMEVDLLCAGARVAVELDGGQHLADSEAYRRDRRKDALLQENSYFVLRFLAEDVGKHLDDVLDAILRTLAHQQRRPS